MPEGLRLPFSAGICLNKRPLTGAGRTARNDRDGRSTVTELMSALGRKQTLATQLSERRLTGDRELVLSIREGRLAVVGSSRSVHLRKRVMIWVRTNNSAICATDPRR